MSKREITVRLQLQTVLKLTFTLKTSELKGSNFTDTGWQDLEAITKHINDWSIKPFTKVEPKKNHIQ